MSVTNINKIFSRSLPWLSFSKNKLKNSSILYPICFIGPIICPQTCRHSQGYQGNRPYAKSMGLRGEGRKFSQVKNKIWTMIYATLLSGVCSLLCNCVRQALYFVSSCQSCKKQSKQPHCRPLDERHSLQATIPKLRCWSRRVTSHPRLAWNIKWNTLSKLNNEKHKLFCIILFGLLFWDGVLWCSPGWLHSLARPASQVLRLLMCWLTYWSQVLIIGSYPFQCNHPQALVSPLHGEFTQNKNQESRLHLPLMVLVSTRVLHRRVFHLYQIIQVRESTEPMN